MLNEHSSKGAPVYHKLVVDSCMRRVRHAHLDKWSVAKIHSESNRTLGITPLSLVDGIDLVTVNLMTKRAVDDVDELLDLCYSTLKVLKLKWFS